MTGQSPLQSDHAAADSEEDQWSDIDEDESEAQVAHALNRRWRQKALVFGQRVAPPLNLDRSIVMNFSFSRAEIKVTPEKSLISLGLKAPSETFKSDQHPTGKATALDEDLGIIGGSRARAPTNPEITGNQAKGNMISDDEDLVLNDEQVRRRRLANELDKELRRALLDVRTAHEGKGKQGTISRHARQAGSPTMDDNSPCSDYYTSVW